MAFRAVLCEKLAESFTNGINALALKSVPSVSLKATDVRIKVHAAALNYFDLLQLVGRYQSKPSLPFIPGAECSGEVIEVGSAAKSTLKVGDQVMVGMSLGTTASELVTPAALCLPKPKSFTYAEAAAFPVGFMTAYHGLVQRGQLKKGETLLITGAAGGMGASAIQLGKLIGAKVIAAASSKSKLEVASALGADYTIDYSTSDLKAEVNKLTEGKYVDVCYEVVGGDIFDKCTRCMGSEGRLLVVGFASGRIPSIPANLPLVKGYSVVGVRAGESFRRHPHLALEMFTDIQKWSKEGLLPPPRIDHVFDASEYKAAFTKLANREVKGKAVIQWVPEAKL